ncbi:putative methyltransferase domain-containing protein [Diaporthe ampelina]|uniref:Putative methyltransferase domain-containing protein n=1 Tax=Diaporthe ampelina TaxID=1214573 RepID=A0A0G2F6L7_9PEZI|nr:putative methyltransferase domain-containing protein [Diaporthe ampelina]
MDDSNPGNFPFAQPQRGLGISAHSQQQEGLGSGRAINSEAPPSGEPGSTAALSDPAGQAPVFGAGNANAQFEPLADEMVQSIPALDFNGFVLHAAPRPVPEELQRDPSGASVAEPDALLDEENGRTYHNYHEGRYYLPNDAAEQDRLDLQHKLWQVHLDDALFKAPIQLPPKNVLDVATGTGIWAIQMARQYPDSNVIGTDLSLIQPEGPPNCSFIKEDAELDEWTLPVLFDYIHLRMVHTCFDDYRALFKKCYDNLEPGGWIELQDAVFKLMCTDGTADGSYIERFSQLILEAGGSIGRDLDIPSKYKEMLIEAGFLDVVEDIGPVPGNPWPDEAKFKSLGHWQMINSHRALRGFGWKLFRKLGMEPDDIEDLVEKAKTDITDSRLHFFFPIYVVYGRKPYEWELEQPPQKRMRT